MSNLEDNRKAAEKLFQEIWNQKDESAIDRYIAQLNGFAKSYQETTWEIEIMATKIIGIKNINLIGLFLIHIQTPFIIYLTFLILYQSLIVY